jgi:PIN domain nuclease of toxin-antitoxin system
MPSLVVDTHTLIWHITADPRLSRLARETLVETARSGDLIYIPPICLVEWIYLVEKGRVPREGLDTLTSALADPRSALKLAAFDLQIIDAIYRIPREIVPDLPDRVIAGTAFALQLPLVSRDARIQASDIKTIW